MKKEREEEKMDLQCNFFSGHRNAPGSKKDWTSSEKDVQVSEELAKELNTYLRLLYNTVEERLGPSSWTVFVCFKIEANRIISVSWGSNPDYKKFPHDIKVMGVEKGLTWKQTQLFKDNLKNWYEMYPLI